MARQAMEGERYEWSCFAAQQAAEKALKAVYQKLGVEAWGHTLTALVDKMPDSVEPPEELMEAAKTLDKHYIPTRYPNGFDSGAPADFYTRKEAQDAIAKATQIVEFCRDQVD